MKSSLSQLSLLAVIAAALAVAPVTSFAQEKKNDKAAEKKAETSDEAKKPNPNRALPFRGKVEAVDKNAKTVTVSGKVYQITSETRIKKDEKPGTLDDGIVGEAARGSYRKTEDGKLNAVSVFFGLKPEAPAEKPVAPAKKAEKAEPGAPKADRQPEP